MKTICLANRKDEVVCGAGQCEIDSEGKVFCAGAGGGAIRGIYGAVQCGVGYCAKDYLGKVWCSTRQSGGAAIDSEGKVKCLEGCEAGSPGLCSVGQPGTGQGYY